jgi:mono/diheme cytochrome c family protein
MRAYLGGRYGKAKAHATEALSAGTAPAVSAMIAARAAHELRRPEDRDRLAGEAARHDADDPTARLMAQAEWLAADGRPGDALELLGTLPAILQTAVLGESSEMPAGSVPVKGYDFNNGVAQIRVAIRVAFALGERLLVGESHGLGHDDELPQQHAVAVLHAEPVDNPLRLFLALDERLLDRVLASPEPRARAAAVRVLGLWRDRLADPLGRLGKAVRDEHPRVRLEAVVALSHVGGQTSLRTALGAVEQPSDKFLDYALKQTVRHLAPTAGKVAAELSAPQAAYLKKVVSSGPAVISPGQAIYESLCLNCHQAAGQGLTGVYPPLAKSDWVAGDVQTLIKITMHGLAGPTKVQGKDYGLVPMPPMGLDDQQLADVLTYVRNAFGNKAPAVKVEDVKAVREATKGRTAPWTAVELGK